MRIALQLLLILFFVSTLWSAAGDADPLFLTGAGVNAPVNEFILEPDGRAVVVGDFTNIVGLPVGRIFRLNSDGSLDPFFNSAGVGANNSIYSIDRLPDGKILIAGAFTSYNGVLVNRIARLYADGTLDPTFTPGTGANGPVREVILQPDGKLLIAGSFSTFSGVTKRMVARLSFDGVLDQSFSIPATLQFNSLNCIAMQADGKVVIGGNFFDDELPIQNLARLHTNGDLDTTFVGTTNGSSLTVFGSILVRSDDKIVIGGSFSEVNGIAKPGLALLNQNGTLDPLTFAQISGGIRRIGLQPDGKYLLVGSSNIFNGRIITRRNADGSIDPTYVSSESTGTVNSVVFANGSAYLGGSLDRNPLATPGASPAAVRRFGDDGSRDISYLTRSGAPGAGEGASRIAIQPDGRIVFFSFGTVGGYPRNGLARISSIGLVDESYAPQINGTSLAGLTDGTTLVGGIADETSLRRKIKRVLADGAIDSNYSMDVIQGVEPLGNPISDLVAQADGKVFVAGDYTSIGGLGRKSLSRLNANGTVDPTFNHSLVIEKASFEKVRLAADRKIWTGGAIKVTSSSPVLSYILKLNENGVYQSETRFQGELGDIAPTRDGKAFVCGRFFSVANNTNYTNVARVNSDGTLDTSFVPPLIGNGVTLAYVFTCLVQPDGKVIIGGNFPVVGGVNRRGIARLNVNGSLDMTYNPGFNDQSVGATVSTHTVQKDGNILVGGSFFYMGNLPRVGIARLFGQKATFSFDFDGDSKTDLGIYRPNGADGSEWWLQRSSDGGGFATPFGAATDRVAAADYTGDGKTDVAFWRPSTGFWFVLRSEDQTFYAFPFGANGDVPVPSDYDADGKADVGVFRPTDNTWYIQRSSDNGTTIQQFGTAGDVPVNADYDGDGKADIAIYRPSLGQWWLMRSSAGNIAYQFGSSTDKTVVGDYTGDGKADVAFWRPSTGEWFVLRSEDNSFFGFPFGISTDTPVPGDYDGDGRNDAGVFRASNNTWYVQRTTAGTLIQQFGIAGDLPLPNAYVR